MWFWCLWGSCGVIADAVVFVIVLVLMLCLCCAGAVLLLLKGGECAAARVRDGCGRVM
jgi:hypothetical protein